VLSVAYVTNRPTHPVVGSPRSQYEFLSDSLHAQTLQSFELVCVIAQGDIPRPELDWLGDRVRYLRPHASPWPAGTFAPSIARNTALAAAHGDIVFGLDDCVSFGPGLLALVMSYAARGLWLAPTYGPPGSASVGQPQPQALCGGIVAYPRALAIELGGWEARYTGCCAYEDWEFSARLGRNGVKFISDPTGHVTLHPHGSRHRGGATRCCYLVDHLLKGQAKANVPWTPDQIAMFEAPKCPLDEGLCKAGGGKCKVPRPTPEVIDIMRGYESQSRELFPG
jgi:hypothetical protein